jgi:hypothetical protein
MEGFKRNSNIEPEPIKVPEMTVIQGGLSNEDAMKNEAALKMKTELDKITPEVMAKNIANPENRKRLNERLKVILIGAVALGFGVLAIESIQDLMNNPSLSEYSKTLVETMREVKVGVFGALTVMTGGVAYVKNSLDNEKWNKLEKAK